MSAAQNLISLKKTIIMVAAYYDRELKPEVVAMMAEDLADLPVLEVMKAYETYRRTAKQHRFPLPAEIRAIVSPEVDADSAAREIAARITAAIPKFGYTNRQAAKEYIGEIGWQVVERQGGWPYLCEHHGREIDPTAFQAQARDLAKAQILYPQAAMAQAIGLPGSYDNRGELTSAGDILKMLGPGMPEGEGA